MKFYKTKSPGRARKTPLQVSFFHLPSMNTARRVSTYGVISGPYFPVFSPNTGKYGPEITSYLDKFHAVEITVGFIQANCIYSVNFTMIYTLSF